MINTPGKHVNKLATNVIRKPAAYCVAYQVFLVKAFSLSEIKFLSFCCERLFLLFEMFYKFSKQVRDLHHFFFSRNTSKADKRWLSRARSSEHVTQKNVSHEAPKVERFI